MIPLEALTWPDAIVTLGFLGLAAFMFWMSFR
jgi:hypothetical protein